MSAVPPFTRQTLHIPSADPRVTLEVWLYLPKGHGEGPFPVVVAGHGVSLVKAAGLQPFGEKWTEVGWASLILDFRGFGGSGGPRNLCSIARQTDDYRSVIKWVENGDRKELFRSDKIILFGFALAGLNITELANKAEEEGIVGVMGQCPVLDGYAIAMSGRVNLRLLVQAALDYIRGKLGFSPVYITVAGKPGLAALLATSTALPGFQALHEHNDKAFAEMPNAVAGRFIFEVLGVRPDISKLGCPMLVVVPEDDELVPHGIALSLIAKASESPIHCVRTPGGHFDVFKGGLGFDVNVKAQQDFLRSFA